MKSERVVLGSLRMKQNGNVSYTQAKVLNKNSVMKFFLPFVCLLCVSRNVLGEEMYHESIYQEEDSYNDLIKINSSCYPRDSCKEERTEDHPGIGYQYSCSCHWQCWQLDTCCIDSPYRDYSPPNHECRSAGDTPSAIAYYMVNKCSGNVNRHSIWKSLCEKEWNGEDDILMLSPVTSLETNATYKNFYCFKCYETTNNFISWNLFLLGSYRNARNAAGDSRSDYKGTHAQGSKTYSVTYDLETKTWVATMVEENIYIPVNLSFQIPLEIHPLPILCNLKIISDCPDTWTNNYVIDKCRAYTAIVHSIYSTNSYKNAHCALCNFESHDNISCLRGTASGFGGTDTFSFKHLLDINQSGREKVGQEGKCKEDHLWDPYGKKCRKLKCALPAYVIKDGNCTPP